MLQRVLSCLGVEFTPVSHTERIVSALGGFLGILAVTWVSADFVGTRSYVLIVASMGASAVLLFAVPHGSLSQPWPTVGGQVISAFIGVTCYKLVPYEFPAAALAVASAIAAMHYLRCIHPPGGATALAAVVGGPGVHALGYHYVLTPVLLNVTIIVLIAFFVNYPFLWRRYPASLARRSHPQPTEAAKPDQETEISHDDLEYALKQMGSFIDVTEEDLVSIYRMASAHAHHALLEPSQIELGRCYSNGLYGENWAVRQLVDQSGGGDQDRVIYKIIAGKGRRNSAVCTREEFAKWAKYEVVLNENSWQRPQ